MIGFIILLIVSVILVGYFKGLQDKAMKTGKGFDWKNKYYQEKDGTLIPIETQKNKISKWYYNYHKLFNLKYLEKNFLSATAFVWRTDKWHEYGFYRHIAEIFPLMYLMFHLEGITLFWSITLSIILFSVKSIGFHISYNWLK